MQNISKYLRHKLRNEICRKIYYARCTFPFTIYKYWITKNRRYKTFIHEDKAVAKSDLPVYGWRCARNIVFSTRRRWNEFEFRAPGKFNYVAGILRNSGLPRHIERMRERERGEYRVPRHAPAVYFSFRFFLSLFKERNTTSCCASPFAIFLPRVRSLSPIIIIEQRGCLTRRKNKSKW